MSETPLGADPIATDPAAAVPDPTGTADVAADPTVAAPAEKTPEQLQAEIDAMQAQINTLIAAQQPAAPEAATPTPAAPAAPAPPPPADVPPAPSAAGTSPTTGAVQPAADPTAAAAPEPPDFGTVPDDVVAGSIVRYTYTPPGADNPATLYGLVLDRVDVDDTTGGPAQAGQPSHAELVVAPLDAAGYRVTGNQLVDDQATS